MSPKVVPQPPRGGARLAWLGPGFLWMVSAAGSGELLFTPRVGALHGFMLSGAAGLLKVAGAIEASPIPVVTVVTLYLNRTRSPSSLQPSRPVMAMTMIAALFVAVFAIYYILQLTVGG